MTHIQTRLPAYREWFQQAAAEVGVDWRLIAAIGYQESQWDPSATSPTGVRGLMMLTEETARGLKIVDRLDPKSSIFGGARYIVSVRDMIPQRIPEPDRTWMALAEYNVGFGHLEDARILTQMHGKNPDKWKTSASTCRCSRRNVVHAGETRLCAGGGNPSASCRTSRRTRPSSTG